MEGERRDRPVLAAQEKGKYQKTIAHRSLTTNSLQVLVLDAIPYPRVSATAATTRPRSACRNIPSEKDSKIPVSYIDSISLR